MYLRVSFEQEFFDLIMYLKSKYPEKLFDLDGIGKQTDMAQFSRDFFSNKTTSDVSIDANANVDDMSVIAYDNELPKPFFRLNSYYVLWKKMRQLYGKEKANNIVEKQLTGDIYVNDFHGIAAGKPYCFNYSSYDIMLGGLPMVRKIKSVAPKHLYSFKSQLEQFVTIAANSTLGATGLADMLIVTSLYVKKILHTKSDVHFKFQSDDDIWRYVEANIESFIYTINQPMRGNQSPFTNVSVYDENFLQNICPEYIWVYEYEGESYQISPEIDLVNKVQNLFLDIMNSELKRTPITFPVTTACFAVDDDNNILDEEFLKTISEKNLDFGFINIYTGKSSTLSSCCRLRSDTENEYFNSFGSGSSKIGSLGVCTMNMPRIAWKAKTEDDFFENIVELINDCQDVNNAKRKIVSRRIENGNHPLYTLGFMELSKQYSTVGINGLYEAVEIMGYDILEEDGQDFVLKILDVINTTNDKLQKKYSAPHNVEQIPAESVAIKLADKDKLLKYNNGEYDLYSNQFIPLINKADLLDRIKIQGIFDKHFSGGAIAHLNIEQKIEDVNVIAELIRSAAKQGVVYFAVNYVLNECENGHMSIGNLDNCPECGGKIVEKFQRVVGFLTPTRTWHKVRRDFDAPNRVFYNKKSISDTKTLM